MTTEKPAHHSTELLEKLFNSIYGMVALLDRDFNFIRVNHAYAAADGREPDELVGKNHFALYPNKENEAIFRRVVESGAPYVTYAKPFEYPGAPERGVTYWDWVLTPMHDASGRVDGVLLILHEVTERVRAEEARLYSEERFRLLFDNTADAIFIHDMQGRFLEVNEVACQRLGYSHDELLTMSVGDIDAPEVMVDFEAKARVLMETGKVLADSCHVSRAGDRIPVEIHARLITYEGEPAVLSLARDVTERKRSQAVERLLHDVDSHVLHADSMERLMDFVCQELVERLGYDVVWIGRKQKGGNIQIISLFGKAQGYGERLREIGVRWDESPLGRGPAGMAIRTGEAQLIRNHEQRFRPWREAADRYGLVAVYAIPLIIKGDVYGVLTLHSSQSGAFESAGELARINSIANRLRIASDTALDQQQLRLLGAALYAAGNGVFITDRDGRIVWVNHSFCQQSGFSGEQLLGQTPRVLKSGKMSGTHYEKMWSAILSGEAWKGEVVERGRDGRLYTVSQTVTPIRDNDGEISHFVSIHEDITAQKEAQERVHYLAHYDVLTGLPNRTLFYDRLLHTIALSKREQGYFALMFLDLDRFKPINDSYGHTVGDQLLHEVALRIRAVVRECDTVARLGGDEFTVILPMIGGEHEAFLVGNKIAEAIAEPYLLDGHEITTSASIGVAIYPEHGSSDRELLIAADSAMYAAKQSGRNCIELAELPAE